MAGTKVSALPAATVLADADLLPIVDVSDTSQAPTGTTKATEATVVRDYIAVRDEKYAVWRSGAVGDGVTDDTDALNAASTIVAAIGGTVLLDRAHLVSDTIEFTGSTIVQGQRGVASHGTVVTSDATSGPVFQISGRSCGVRKVSIDSTDDRRGATTTTGHGVMIAGPDVAAASYPSLSRQDLSDVSILNQPTDGLHLIGTMEFSNFENITVADCIRHGFVTDGGTVAGYSNAQIPAFGVQFDRCRAIECGGQALIVHSSGGNSPWGILFDHFEALGCAWDSTKRYSTSLYQIYIEGGVGIKFIMPDVEDQQYAATTTSTGGKARTGAANPGKGFRVAASGVMIEMPFFSSLAESYSQVSGTGVEIKYPRIFNGAYGTPQNPAILVASGVKDAEVKWAAANSEATQTVRNQSVNARIVADGIPQIGDTFSAFDYADGLVPVAVEISGGVLTTTARRTQVEGQGAAADDLVTLRLASGINGSTGMDMLLFRGGEDITVKHGTGNIRTVTAADVTMTSTANTVLHFAYDGTNWIQL